MESWVLLGKLCAVGAACMITRRLLRTLRLTETAFPRLVYTFNYLQPPMLTADTDHQITEHATPAPAPALAPRP
ncbi:MAG: hypothetical protein JXR37_36430 [Kiritimatiellae bacterium]|nr:hypothetical protein [Kiritimatiellia bacterium]